ncbi:HNH endonuclease [Bacillus thuringiensis]|uniref:HNH endonuclease n=1 Tax=Bacillus thuringiensis TaxID=1428 RepID=UPI002AB4B85E|nr:HNH endonuclease [Bacillus thuringiensis]MDY7965179.1 HNH endonuclease [Bacillus thuringiensis]HDR7799671.1 HNH endonuclease [Bacillus tropicus]
MDMYELAVDPFLYSFSNQDQNQEENITFGDKSNRKCMYCGKTKGETTFKKDAHVIPAGLGNRVLFNYDECDTCNEHYFSNHENELANFLMLDRIFIGARKRNGMPKYKPSSKGNSAIQHSPDSHTVHIQMNDLEGKFEIIQDLENKKATYKINNPLKYRAADICKALTHMIWPFLSVEKREQLKHIPNWLLGKEDIFPLYLETVFVPGNGYRKGILEYWESTNEDSLYPVMVRFTFGLSILSFYIPSTLQVQSLPIRHGGYWQIKEYTAGVKIKGLKILNNGHVQLNHLTYTLNFQSIDEIK